MAAPALPWRRLGLEELEIVESIVRSLMGGDEAHGWPHIVRVGLLAERISRGLRVDKKVLYAAIMLHDIGRSLPGDGHHAVKSAAFAEKLLRGLGFRHGEVEAVKHAILAHSYSLGVKPETLEAMVLSDADKLDALGVVGAARAFITGHEMGRSVWESLEHFAEKLLELPRLMHLEQSRRIAERRARILVAMLEESILEAEEYGLDWRPPGLKP